MSDTKSFLEKVKNVVSYAAIIGIGLGVGLAANEGWAWYNKAPEYFQVDTSAHFENTNEKVIVYSTQWCPYCKKTKEYLTANNIAMF